MGQKTNQKQTHHKTKDSPEKQTTQNTAKQNQPGSVVSYDTQPGNKVSLFYNAPQGANSSVPTLGHDIHKKPRPSIHSQA